MPGWGSILDLLVKTLLLQAVALFLAWTLRRSSASLRHLVLAAGTAGVLLVPALSLVLPKWGPPLLPRLSAVVDRPSAVVAPGGAEGGTIPPVVEPRAPLGGVLAAWLAGSVLVLAWRLAQWARAARLARRATPIDDAGLLGSAARLRSRAGIEGEVALLVSPEINVPGIQGIRRPKILLPPGALEWPPVQLETILRHELAHVVRRDLLVQLVAQVGCALYWFNPMSWVLERKLMIERERACDDSVLRQDVRASDYADHLLRVSERLGPRRQPAWSTIPMAEGTDFKDRILSVLDPNAERTAPGRAKSSLVLGLLAAFVLPLSGLSLWDNPLSAQESAPPAVEGVQPPAAPRPGSGPTGASGGEVDLLALLTAQLEDADVGVREHAATALKELGDRRAVPALVGRLRDENASVREHVASALGTLRDKRAAEPLAAALAQEKDPRAREHMISALQRLRGAD